MSIHPIWKDFPSLRTDLAAVSDQIRRVVEQSPEAIKNDLARLLLSKGKMLRPAFVILSSGWGREQNENLPAVAAAVELLHLASLVHDDVLDDAVSRRGVATLHQTMGIKKAVLTGDYLLGIAMKLGMSEFRKENVPVMMESLNRLLESEIDQDFSLKSMNIDRESYLKRIKGKTAELFGLSCITGAIVSGCDENLVERLQKLGILFGMAFQIDDDILDYTGSKGLLGKNTGKDLKEGIPTLPFILALEEGDKKVLAYTGSSFRRIFPGSLQRYLIRKGYVEKAVVISDSYKKEAEELLLSLPECASKEIFLRVLKTFQKRDC